MLIGLIAVISIAALAVLGGTVSEQYCRIAQKLGSDITCASSEGGNGEPGNGEVSEDAQALGLIFAPKVNQPLGVMVYSAPARTRGAAALPISITGGRYAIGGGAMTDAPGTLPAGAMLTVEVLSSTSYSTPVSATITVGEASASFVATTRAAVSVPVGLADFQPDGSEDPATPGSTWTSLVQALYGLEVATDIEVSGPGNPEYRLVRGGNPVGSWSATAASVQPGDAVQVRMTSPTARDSQQAATVTIGGASVHFVAQTGPAPEEVAFGDFAPRTDVEPATLVVSNVQLPSGIDGAAPVSISGEGNPEYRVMTGGIWGAWTDNGGSIAAGGSLQVRLTAASDYATLRGLTLVVGTASGDFQVTTRAINLDPSIFSDFPPRNDLPVETLAASVTQVVGGFDAASPISVIGPEASYAINGGAWTSDAGTISPGDNVAVRVKTSADFGVAATAELTIGGVTRSFVATTRAAATVPVGLVDFPPVTGADPASLHESTIQTVHGLEAPAEVSVSGAEYRVFTSSGSVAEDWRSGGATVPVDGRIQMRIIASPDYEVARTGTITVGGVSANFRVTTRAIIDSPAALADFETQTGIEPGMVVLSNEQQIAGLEAPAAVSIVTGSGAEMLIRNSDGNVFADWSAAPGYLPINGYVQVRMPAAASFATSSQMTIQVGSKQADFVVMTREANLTPVGMSDFAPVSGVNPGAVTSSEIKDILGLEAGAEVSIAGAGAEFQVFNASNVVLRGWGDAATTVPVGGKVQVRLVAAASFETPVTATLTVDSQTAGFVVTTRAASATPQALVDFTPVTGATPSDLLTSNIQSVQGLDVPAAVSIAGGDEAEYQVLDASDMVVVAWTSSAATVPVSGKVMVRQRAAASYGATSVTTLTVGDTEADFAVTVRDAMTAPTGLADFTAVVDVNPSSLQTSNVQAITGTEGPAAVTIAGDGAEFQVLDATNAVLRSWSSAATTVPVGGKVQVRMPADAAFSTLKTATLSVGGVDARFRVTTRAASGVPQALVDFAPVTDANPSAITPSNRQQVSGLEAPTSVSVTGDGSPQIQISDASATVVTAWTSGPATVPINGFVEVRLTASASYGGTATAQVSVGGVSANFAVSTRDAVTTPTTLANFATVSGVAPAAVTASATQAMTGLEAPATVSVSGGNNAQIRVLSAASAVLTDWTSATVSIANGNLLQVRQTAGANGATVTATVQVGTRSASFAVVTGDFIPDDFVVATTDTGPGLTRTTSTAVTPTGFTVALPISVSGSTGSPLLSIAGGAQVSSGTILPGQSFTVSMLAGAEDGSSRMATVILGDVAYGQKTADWELIAYDVTPDPALAFAQTIGNVAGQWAVSGSVTLSGLGHATVISAGTSSGGTSGYVSVNGGTWGRSLSASDGDSVRVRQFIPTTAGSNQTYTLPVTTVGLDGRTIATTSFAAVTGGSDRVPNAFSITATTGATPNGTAYSVDITPTGYDSAATIRITNDTTARVSIAGGAYVRADATTSVTLQPGQSFKVSTATGAVSTSKTVTVAIGDFAAGSTVSANWSVTVRAADTTPDAGTYAPSPLTVATAQAYRAYVISNSITPTGYTEAAVVKITGVSGPNTATADTSISINGGSWTAPDASGVLGSLTPGDNYRLRHYVTRASGTSRAVTMTVGAASAFTWTIPTLDMYPDAAPSILAQSGPPDVTVYASTGTTTAYGPNASDIWTWTISGLDTGVSVPIATLSGDMGMRLRTGIAGNYKTAGVSSVKNGDVIMMIDVSANPGTTATSTYDIGGRTTGFTATRTYDTTDPDSGYNIPWKTDSVLNTTNVSAFVTPQKFGASMQVHVDTTSTPTVAGVSYSCSEGVSAQLNTSANTTSWTASKTLNMGEQIRVRVPQSTSTARTVCIRYNGTSAASGGLLYVWRSMVGVGNDATPNTFIIGSRASEADSTELTYDGAQHCVSLRDRDSDSAGLRGFNTPISVALTQTAVGSVNSWESPDSVLWLKHNDTDKPRISAGGGSSVATDVIPGDSIQVCVSRPRYAGTSFTARVTAGGVVATKVFTFPAVDNDPVAPSFTASTATEAGVAYYSNTVAMSGTVGPVYATISGDSTAYMSIAGGAYTRSPTWVDPGKTIQIRMISGPTDGTSVKTATVSLAGRNTAGNEVTRSGTWTLTSADLLASNMTFVNPAISDPGALVYSSGTPSVAGLGVGLTTTWAATRSESDGTSATASINGSSSRTSAGTVTNGDTVRLYRTLPATFDATVVTNFVVNGTVVGSMTAKTRPADTTPNAFGWTPTIGATANQLVQSIRILPDGYKDAAPIVVLQGATDLQMSVNEEAYTAIDSGAVLAQGQDIALRARAGAAGSSTTVRLSIGGVIGEWVIEAE